MLITLIKRMLVAWLWLVAALLLSCRVNPRLDRRLIVLNVVNSSDTTPSGIYLDCQCSGSVSSCGRLNIEGEIRPATRVVRPLRDHFSWCDRGLSFRVFASESGVVHDVGYLGVYSSELEWDEFCVSIQPDSRWITEVAAQGETCAERISRATR